VRYKTAVSQVDRDRQIEALVGTMRDFYAFMRGTEQMKKYESQRDILVVMVKQTEECGYFIQGYARTISLRMCFPAATNLASLIASFLSALRAIKNQFHSVNDQIKQYQDKFAHLRSAFLGHVSLQTEVIVMRILDDVSSLSELFY
jgi:hypothetical protein